MVEAVIASTWPPSLLTVSGWDGTYHGHDVKQGVYFVVVKAKGADGIHYNIRKDINLLRGYTDKTGPN